MQGLISKSAFMNNSSWSTLLFGGRERDLEQCEPFLLTCGIYLTGIRVVIVDVEEVLRTLHLEDKLLLIGRHTDVDRGVEGGVHQGNDGAVGHDSVNGVCHTC